MKINLSNFETSDVSLFDVSIVQRDVGGGKTEKRGHRLFRGISNSKTVDYIGTINSGNVLNI